MAPIPSSEWNLLTPKTEKVPTQDDPDDPIVDQEMTYYELPAYNGKTLKFTIEKFGDRPPAGYAAYVALHGGGGDEARQNQDKKLAQWRARSNNDAWHMMAVGLYRRNFKGGDKNNPNVGIEGAIYICPRGIVDDWNLHFRPESYYLFDQMITKLLQPAPKPLVNSNQIFLTGFSAGGDGVYRQAANLTDRWAAANASSGHPGDVVFDNFANLPFCSQVGEKDSTVTNRALAVVGASVDKLTRLENDAIKRGISGLYIHDCFLYTQGWNYQTDKPEPALHANWERAEDGNLVSTAVKQDKLATWLQNNLKGPTETPASDLERTNSNAIRWLRQYEVKGQKYNRNRNPVPQNVIWNLASRPGQPRDKNDRPIPGWEPKRFFYWVYLKHSPSKAFDPAAIIRASYNANERWVQIDQPNDYTVLLLNEDMFSSEGKLDKPISVYAGPKDGKTKAQKITVQKSEKIRQRTFQARGDKKLEFSAMVYFTWNPSGGGYWEVKSADSLDPVETANPPKARL
ncbi:hypothetical protein AYL99_01140 [Fonsecaea erecta]|uniref:Uncharacterized protein n=1 Tax=Fonsecaea erecta TaxID=1367422 RepID=A0A178ZZA7_9EURO|nr:hypothetical protein AYL99_01140 [Fonsecaea erecta]OAP65168.1 hypothetical protein AYL99_01140 [Fonsecaea erecta]